MTLGDLQENEKIIDNLIETAKNNFKDECFEHHLVNKTRAMIGSGGEVK